LQQKPLKLASMVQEEVRRRDRDTADRQQKDRHREREREKDRDRGRRSEKEVEKDAPYEKGRSRGDEDYRSGSRRTEAEQNDEAAPSSKELEDRIRR
jgi:hypothetical protein